MTRSFLALALAAVACSSPTAAVDEPMTGTWESLGWRVGGPWVYELVQNGGGLDGTFTAVNFFPSIDVSSRARGSYKHPDIYLQWHLGWGPERVWICHYDGIVDEDLVRIDGVMRCLDDEGRDTWADDQLILGRRE